MSRLPRIIEDEREFLDMAKGKIRKDMKKYLGRGQIRVRRRGEGKSIEIPVEEFEIPTFRFGFPADMFIGQGDGEQGDDLGPVQKPDDEGDEKSAGPGHGGRHIIVDLPEHEFEKMFQEILELPRIKPKGDRSIFEERQKYSTISHTGPMSLLHRRRTFLKAMQHAIVLGEFQPPEKSTILVYPKDRKFRSYQTIREPKNNAVVFYKRDGSGSMGPAEREIVSRLVALCDFWLSWNYDKLETVFIIHDGEAYEVTRHEFFNENWGGGTICSTALEKMHAISEERFPQSQWNIYGVYLSDGFNFSSDDEKFVEVLREKILPMVNQFNYGQIQAMRGWFSAYEGSGSKTFMPPGTIGKIIKDKFGDVENVAQTVIQSEDEESLITAIRVFFSKGN